MSVLVTGGAGYIGSHMVLELLNTGERVVVLDNLSTGFRWAVDDAAEFETGDIGNREQVEQIITDHEVDAVIHFAGSIIAPESLTAPLQYYSNNTANSRTLIEACINTGVAHFIFSSTAAVYGMPASNPVFEDAPFDPISPYGASKMMTEIMLRDISAAHDINYAALRYFNVAGADPTGRTGQSTKNATHLIKVACQTALGLRPSMEVYGTDYPTTDGTCIRDYIHVTDLAHAHNLALGYLRNKHENLVVNCGYGRGFSVLEVIKAVQLVTGCEFDVRMAARRGGDPAEIVAGTRLIHEMLDWTPAFNDLNEIVKHAYHWEQSILDRKSLKVMPN